MQPLIRKLKGTVKMIGDGLFYGPWRASRVSSYSFDYVSDDVFHSKVRFCMTKDIRARYVIRYSSDSSCTQLSLQHTEPRSEVPSQTTRPTHIPALQSSLHLCLPTSFFSQIISSDHNAMSRPYFIAAYGNQPTSTNCEELAFPPSPILHISHKLTRPMPTLHARRFVYVGAAAGPVAAPANALRLAQQHHHRASTLSLLNNPSSLLRRTNLPPETPSYHPV